MRYLKCFALDTFFEPSLYASYPKKEELKDLDIKVLSMYGSKDGVADLQTEYLILLFRIKRLGGLNK